MMAVVKSPQTTLFGITSSNESCIVHRAFHPFYYYALRVRCVTPVVLVIVPSWNDEWVR